MNGSGDRRQADRECHVSLPKFPTKKPRKTTRTASPPAACVLRACLRAAVWCAVFFFGGRSDLKAQWPYIPSGGGSVCCLPFWFFSPGSRLQLKMEDGAQASSLEQGASGGIHKPQERAPHACPCVLRAGAPVAGNRPNKAPGGQTRTTGRSLTCSLTSRTKGGKMHKRIAGAPGRVPCCPRVSELLVIARVEFRVPRDEQRRLCGSQP